MSDYGPVAWGLDNDGKLYHTKIIKQFKSKIAYFHNIFGLGENGHIYSYNDLDNDSCWVRRCKFKDIDEMIDNDDIVQEIKNHFSHLIIFLENNEFY